MEHNEYNMYLSKEERMRAVLPFMPEAVVVGNGDFPSHPFPLAVLDASGAATAQMDVEQAVLDVYSSGDGLVYLTSDSIVLTDSALTVQHQYENNRSYNQAVRLGNICYVIGTDTFDRLEPEEGNE